MAAETCSSAAQGTTASGATSGELGATHLRSSPAASTASCFANGSGQDTIFDFENDKDVIDLTGFAGITGFDQVGAQSSQSGANTIIDLGAAATAGATTGSGRAHLGQLQRRQPRRAGFPDLTSRPPARGRGRSAIGRPGMTMRTSSPLDLRRLPISRRPASSVTS